jgi:hypothetical protein
MASRGAGRGSSREVAVAGGWPARGRPGLITKAASAAERGSEQTERQLVGGCWTLSRCFCAFAEIKIAL